MGDERFGSNYWRSISVRRHAENVGVEGGDEPAREAPEPDPGRREPPEADEEFYLRAQALGFGEDDILSILTHTKGDPIPDMALAWEKVLEAETERGPW